MTQSPVAPERSVLFVAYHFPPMRSAGVERSAKFVRYLPDFGYSARVLSTAAFGGEPGDGVLRAWEPLGLYRRWRNPAARANPQAASRTRTPGLSAGWLQALRQILLVPDGQITWLPGAAWSGLRALRRQSMDLIYTTSPPTSSHLLGRLLKAQTGLPWVADFRDAWLYDPLDPALLRMPYRREFERRLEASVLAEADRIVTATQISADDLRLRYPQQAHKIRIVTNGFDPADGTPLPEGLVIDDRTRTGPQEAEALADELPAPGGPLRLVHTGSFAYSHPQRTPLPLLSALRRLVGLELVWAERLQLTLVGELSPEEQAAAKGIARVVGAVDRATALGFQRRADVLLVVDHRRPWPASNAPGKLFEYLAAGKPVLALCGPGEIENLVTRLEAGICVAPDDIDAIDEALRDLWDQHEQDRLPRVKASLEPFHRRELTRQLTACFDEVIG
ncbi:MAG: glycosyltransferase [bacterium]|nr:glycosyltransferase [bacterium]